MKLNIDFIKKRPVLSTALIVGGGLVLYFVFFKDESGSSESPQAMGYANTQVAAASEMQVLNAQAQIQGQQMQAQLAGMQIQANSELAQVEAQGDVQLALAAMSLQAHQIDQATQMFGIQQQAALEHAGMESAESIAQMQYSSQLAALQSNNARDVALQQMMTQAQVGIANMGAQVSMAGIHAQENISVQTLQATVNMAELSYGAQIALGEQNIEGQRINANTQLGIAREQGRTARQGSSNSMWGAIAGAAIMAFSDVNIKTVHGCVDSERCLMAIQNAPVDFWTYIGGSIADDGGKVHCGTYSQTFYQLIGAADYSQRTQIDIVDYMGALTGAIQHLSKGIPHATKH